MSKILIGIPTVSNVDASFFASILSMRYDDGNQYMTYVKSNSLIYNARIEIAHEAIRAGADYLMFIDSDMVCQSDTVKRMVAGIHGKDFLTSLYFRRRMPTKPLILKYLEWYQDETLGAQTYAETYEDYPRDSVFEVEGCGFGCCIMRTEIAKRMEIACNGNPWTPLPNLSEDFAFCWRARQIEGIKLWCDSSIRPGHAGLHVYTQDDWIKQMEARRI